MIHNIKLTEQAILAIHNSIWNKQEEVVIDNKAYTFEKARSGYSYLDVHDPDLRRGDIRFQKQNPSKQSKFGKMAREGHTITWGICDPPQNWLLVIDTEIKVFK